jgi:hypothetical protein
MDSENLFKIMAVILLVVVAAEGAVILTKEPTQDQVVDESYAMLKEKIELLNSNGGKIQFANSHFNEVPAGSNLVKIKGEYLFIAAHSGYSEELASMSSIAYILINK